MPSLVVFDSYFGNTEVVARAIAEALQAAGHARAVRVDALEAGTLEGVTLLVVGSPTRAFGPSPNVKAWLAKLPPGQLDGVRVAAFDTRVDASAITNPVLSRLLGWFGYAGAKVERQLLRAGGDLAAPANGFVVEGKTGPLREGETDRARAWARAMIAA